DWDAPELPGAVVEAWERVTDDYELHRVEIGLRPGSRSDKQYMYCIPDRDVLVLKMEEAEVSGLQVLDD
ncbi:hypothetical protein QBC32DRAFT_185152, partial [Pseudoneurospora amorphoporcata]